MSIDRLELPDYELDDLQIVTATAEMKAMFHPLRGTLLELVLERAATVGDLAAAVHRPPSTVAYHVNVLVDAGLFKVVRTRKVRAIEERFYGRTARILYVGEVKPDDRPVLVNRLAEAARESMPAHDADDLRVLHRHARISSDRVVEFWNEVMALARTFSASPRSGTTSYAFVAGLYPTDYPTLPPIDAPPAAHRRRAASGRARKGTGARRQA